MNVDTDVFLALREQVAAHDEELRNARVTLDAVFALMRAAVRAAGIDPYATEPELRVLTGGAPPGSRARPRGHLIAVGHDRPTGSARPARPGAGTGR